MHQSGHVMKTLRWCIVVHSSAILASVLLLVTSHQGIMSEVSIDIQAPDEYRLKVQSELLSRALIVRRLGRPTESRLPRGSMGIRLNSGYAYLKMGRQEIVLEF